MIKTPSNPHISARDASLLYGIVFHPCMVNESLMYVHVL